MITLAERYAAGDSLRDISETTGLSHETVRTRLMADGVTLRLPLAPLGKRNPRRVLDREIITDLAVRSAPMTLDDLAEWLGQEPRLLLKVLRRLIREGRLAVTVPRPWREAQ